MQPDRRFVGSAGLALFGAAIFGSAFLIFLVQPLVGKHLLPRFGGTPGVWLVCLAFYQSTLFLGYAYAHGLAARVAPRLQVAVHAALFLGALATLPVLPDAAWRPAAGVEPSGRILALLLANVEAPFLLLASTGPLVQVWFARAFAGRSPYPLYAVSNLGSLLALLSFPFLLEPLWPLSTLSQGWSLAFGACGVLILGCALWAARVAPSPASAAGPAEPVGAARAALWVALAASAVVLMMGVTNHLTVDVASVPFLWVITLSVYLASFILCFASERSYRRGIFLPAALLLLFAILAREQELLPAPWLALSQWLPVEIALYALALFGGCVVAHGELYRLRPALPSLTLFYLWVSGGGALGGLFVGLVAPRLLQDYFELPLAIALGWLAILAAWRLEPPAGLRGTRAALAWTALAALGLGALALWLPGASRSGDGVLFQRRSFFGVLRVTEGTYLRLGKERRLMSGTTLHGAQFEDEALRRVTTSYYAEPSGVALALAMRGAAGPVHVGVIGLGVGTLAAYGRDGDRFVFYEIDPEVVRLARDSVHFSFLADSAAAIELVEGDARLSLDAEYRERGPRGFDLLVVDAFSSDAVPVHLLTREAMRLYRRHLRPGGWLAFNTSNRHFRLMPLVFRVAESLNLHALGVENATLSRLYATESSWTIVGPDPGALEKLDDRARGLRRQHALEPDAIAFARGRAEADWPLWTDDYSDLLSLLAPPAPLAPSELEVDER